MPRQLYEWDIINIPSVTFEYCCTAEDCSKEVMMIKERLREAQNMPEYSKIHCHSCPKKPSSDKNFFRRKYVQHHTYCDMTPESQNSRARVDVHCKAMTR